MPFLSRVPARMRVNVCTVRVSDGCSEVVTGVFRVEPGLCHQLVNRTPSAMLSKRERLKKGVQQLSERACLPSAESDTRVKDINSAGDVNEK